MNMEMEMETDITVSTTGMQLQDTQVKVCPEFSHSIYYVLE
jgi:hypothetical protein